MLTPAWACSAPTLSPAGLGLTSGLEDGLPGGTIPSCSCSWSHTPFPAPPSWGALAPSTLAVPWGKGLGPPRLRPPSCCWIFALLLTRKGALPSP